MSAAIIQGAGRKKKQDKQEYFDGLYVRKKLYYHYSQMLRQKRTKT